MSDLLYGALAVVILYSGLRMAERGELDRIVAGASRVARRIVSPSVPLIPWPPGGAR